MIRASANYITANASLTKKPVLLITIAGYPRSFATNATGTNPLIIPIESDEDLDTSVSDLEGGANLGELSFTVSDRGGLITGDFPTFVFEGKAIVLKTGFVGMSTADYVTLFTGKVDTVASANDNNSYTFTCVDNLGALSKIIYTVADDGGATDSDHVRTLNGHPLDIMIAALETEVGIAATAINILKIASYRDTVFAGLNFTFSIDSPPVAKDFIEQQILKPMGGYMWPNNLGQVDVNFFYPNNHYGAYEFAAIGAFVDGSGVVVGRPFPLPLLAIGDSFSVVAPTGTVTLQVGASDHYWPDNIGGWTLDISGATLVVDSKRRPWNSSSNPDLAFTETGSTSPSGVSATAGNTYVIEYMGTTAQFGVGGVFTTPVGYVGSAPHPDSPGKYAYGTKVGLVFSINHDNIEDNGIPLAQQADLVNSVHFKFDKDSQGTFRADDVETYALSTARYGQFGTQDIEADGLRSGFQGFFQSAVTARLIFYRYGLKNLKFEEVPVLWDACLLEPGDIVDLTSPLIPDREAGVIGISGKLFEVLDRSWNFTDHIVTLTLLDASYLSRFGNYLIAPNGMADYASASAANKALYMFMADDTDLYSDASAAHTLG